jgi:hypothetical protein
MIPPSSVKNHSYLLPLSVRIFARVALQKVLEQHEASNLKHNMEAERFSEIQNKMKKMEQENEDFKKKYEHLQQERNHSLEEAKCMHSNEEAKCIQLKLDIECLKQILQEKDQVKSTI